MHEWTGQVAPDLFPRSWGRDPFWHRTSESIDSEEMQYIDIRSIGGRQDAEGRRHKAGCSTRFGISKESHPHLYHF